MAIGRKDKKCYHVTISISPRKNGQLGKLKYKKQALMSAATTVISLPSTATQGGASSIKSSNTSITPIFEGPNNFNIMWRRAHLGVQNYQARQLHKVIFLESKSIARILCNSRLVTEIHKTNQEWEPLTNGGPLETKDQSQDLDFCGTNLIQLQTYLQPYALTNSQSIHPTTRTMMKTNIEWIPMMLPTS